MTNKFLSNSMIFYFLFCLFLLPSQAFAHQPHDPVGALALSPNFTEDQTLLIGTGMLTTAPGYLFLKSTNGGTDFSALPNFPNEEILQISFSSDTKNKEIFVATKKGEILRSTQSQINWEKIGNFKETNFVSLAFSPVFEKDHRMLAIRDTGELVESRDFGKSWSKIYLGKAKATSANYSSNYSLDQTIVVATKLYGIFLVTKTDIKTFSYSREAKKKLVTTVAYKSLDKKNGVIFLGTKEGSAFKIDLSDNIYSGPQSKAKWKKCSDIHRDLTHQTKSHYSSILISPNYVNDKRVFLASFEGLWETTDGGTNWLYKNILPSETVRSLAISKEFSKNKTAFAAAYGAGILKTVDGGLTWKASKEGLPQPYPHPIAISPTYNKDKTVFSGTPQATEISKDGGLTWKPTSGVDFPIYTREVVISPEFEKDGTVIVGANNELTGNPLWFPGKENKLSVSGVFISTDRGKSWQATGLNNVGVYSLAISPQFPDDPSIFAVSYPQGLFSSVNKGKSWKHITSHNVKCCVHKMALSNEYSKDKTIFLTAILGEEKTDGLYFSKNGGTSWDKSNGLEEITVLDVSVSPNFSKDGVVFVGTLQKGILRSDNRGQSFHPTNFTEPYVTAMAVSPDFTKDGTIIAAAYAGIFVTNDKGQTWKKATISK